jgi:hypothetical protein
MLFYFLSAAEGKTDFRFPITPAKLLGGDQKISNGAANTSFLLMTLKYIGATKQIAPMYWCCQHVKNLRNQLHQYFSCYYHGSTITLVLSAL